MIRQRCAQRRTRLEIPSLAEDPESDPRMVGEAEDTPQRLQFGPSDLRNGQFHHDHAH
jgi:hypothetical protein